MRRITIMAFAALALTACGRGAEHGPANVSRDDQSCALIGDVTTLFGAGAQHFGYPSLDTMAGTCEFMSADGKRSADIITYTADSLHGVTPEAQMQIVTTAWDAQTETPLAAVANLGDAAQIATGLPGYQTQIAFRKGGTLVLIAARSGDDSVTGEQLARSVATAAVANVH
ncbi:MAG: hypothetical protein WAU68_04465 [Vitreimonas sp.]